MNVKEYLDNRGLKTVDNPNYNPKAKKNKQPKTISVPDLAPSNDPITQMAIRDETNRWSVSKATYDHYADAGIEFTRFDNLDKELADHQSNWTKAFNALGQTIVGEIVLGTARGITDLFDFVTSKILHVTEDDYQNPASELIEKWQDDFREKVMPVYADPSLDISNGGLGDFGWWMKNLPNIGSTLSLLFPARWGAGIVNAIGKAARVGKMAGKARKWVSFVDKVDDYSKLNKAQVFINNPKNIARFNEGFKLIEEGLLMRTMENYQEARDTHKQTYQAALDKLSSMTPEELQAFYDSNPELLEGLDNPTYNEVAKVIAKKAADRTYTMDFANTIFDIIQLHGLKSIKGVRMGEKAKGRIVREAQKESVQAAKSVGAKAAGVAEEAAKEVAKKSLPLRAFNRIKDFARFNAKTILEESTEGIEEGINYIAQQEGLTYGKALIDGTYKESGDRYGDGFWNSGITGTFLNMQNNVSDYLKAPELQESAFWGVMGGWLFGMVGTASNNIRASLHEKSAQRELNKLLEGNKITGERLEDKEGWLSMLDMPQSKAAVTAIRMRQSRFEQAVYDLKEIDKGIDIFAQSDESGQKPNFTGDVATKKAIAKQQVMNDFVQQVTMDAINSGTYDMLVDYFKSDEVKQAMVQAGLSSSDVVGSNTEEILRTMEETKNEYVRQSAHVLNQISALNASRRYKETIPLEYAQIIAQQNTNTLIAVHNLDKQIANMTRLSEEDEATLREHGNDGDFASIRAIVRTSSLVDLYSRLDSEYRDLLKQEKEGKVDAFEIDAAKRANRAQSENVVKELRKVGGVAGLFAAVKYAKAYTYQGNGKHDFDNNVFERSDEEVLQEAKDIFADDFAKNSDEVVMQAAQATQSQMNVIFGKDGFANSQEALFTKYATLAQFELQRNIYMSQIASSRSQISNKVDYLHNQHNQARKNIIKQATDIVKNAALQYANETNNDGENILDVLFKAYSSDVQEARRLAEEFMSTDESSGMVTANQFMDALQALNFTAAANQNIYNVLQNIVRRHQMQQRQQRARDKAEDENNNNDNDNKDSNENESGLTYVDPETGEEHNGEMAPTVIFDPSEAEEQQDTRPKKGARIVLNNTGKITTIKHATTAKQKNVNMFDNGDGTFELDIKSLPVEEQVRYANAGLLATEVPLNDVNTEWEVVENPVVKRGKKGLEIVSRGVIGEKETSQEEQQSGSPITGTPINIDSETNDKEETNDEEKHPVEADSPDDEEEEEEVEQNKDEEESTRPSSAKNSNPFDATGHRKGIDVDSIDTTEEAKEVIRKIFAAQEAVDKEATDSKSYWIREEDGLLHAYDRMHSRMGDNAIMDEATKQVIDKWTNELNKYIGTDSFNDFNALLKLIEEEENINLPSLRLESNAHNITKHIVDLVINEIKSKYTFGPNAKRALKAGSAVDEIIRAFFNNEEVIKPDELTDLAFEKLVKQLQRIKSIIDRNGETFLTNNLVLYHRYENGERVAGEVDILAVTKDGRFRIYDVKTSGSSFHEIERGGTLVNYFESTRMDPETGEKVDILDRTRNRMSTKDYYTLQLSGYRNLFANQFGVIADRLMIVPFKLTYGPDNKVIDVVHEEDIMMDYNPNVNVPVENAETKQRMDEFDANQRRMELGEDESDYSSTGEPDQSSDEETQESDEETVDEQSTEQPAEQPAEQRTSVPYAEKHNEIIRGISAEISKHIPDLRSTNIDFDAVAQQTKAVLLPKADQVGVDKDMLSALIDQRIEDYKNANAQLIQLQNSTNASPLTSAAQGLTFAAKFEESGVIDFSNLFISSIEHFMEEYKKIMVVPEVDGKQVIRIGDILRICNSVYGKTDKSIARAMYQLITDYLSLPTSQEKYMILDENEGESIVDKIDKNETKENNLAILDDYRIDIASVLNDVNASSQQNREEFYKVFDSLQNGDELDMEVTDTEILFKKDGKVIGRAGIPKIRGGRWYNVNEGWVSDVEIDKHGNPLSKAKDIIEDIFTGQSSAHNDLRTELVKLQYLESTKRENPNYDAERKQAIKNIANNPIMQQLANQARNTVNSNGNILFCDAKTKNVPLELAAEHLSKLWNYSTKELIANNVAQNNVIIKANLDRWFLELNRSYEAMSQVTGKHKVTIANINEGQIIRATNNSANYYEMPLASEALSEKTDGRMAIVSTQDSSSISVSGRSNIASNGFHVGSTLMAVFSRNGQADFVKAMGVRMDDRVGIQNSELRNIGNAVKQHLIDLLQDILEGKISNPNAALEEAITSIVQVRGVTNKIPIFKAMKGRFVIETIQIPNSVATGITVNYTDGVNNRRFRFYTRTPKGYNLGYVDTVSKSTNSWGVKEKDMKRVLAEQTADAFLQFLKANCNVAISQIGIQADNVKNSNLKGFITQKNGKLNVNIPCSTRAAYNKDFDSYHDYLVKGNMVRLNTKKGENGSNFESRGTNQRANQTLYVSLSNVINPQKSTSRRTNNQVQSGTDIILDTAVKKDHDEVKNIIQNNETNAGLEIFRTILGNDFFEQFKAVSEEENILNEILPASIYYDPNINGRKTDDEGNTRWLGAIAYSSVKNNAVYTQMRSGQKHDARMPSGKHVAVGSYWMNLASHSTREKRKEAIRKLLHEQLHLKLQSNPNRIELLKEIAKIYQEYRTQLEHDLATVKDPQVLKVLRNLDALKANYKGERLIEEFLVESLTNKPLFDYLNQIDSQGQTQTKKDNNIITKIFNVIAKIFGFKVKDNTLMMKELNAIRDILNDDSNNSSENNEDNQTDNQSIEENTSDTSSPVEENTNDSSTPTNPINPTFTGNRFDTSSLKQDDIDTDEDDDLDLFASQFEESSGSIYTQEEQEILNNAPRDEEGNLLAPNGKPSNLNEKQYAQVRTKAFKNWFGDWETIAKNKVSGNIEKDIENRLYNILGEKVVVKLNNESVYDSSYSIFNQNGEEIFNIGLGKTTKGYTVKSVETSENYRRKHIASNVYQIIGSNLLQKGQVLHSSSAQHQFTLKDENGRSIAPATKLWSNLVKQGIAKRTTNGVVAEYEIISPLYDNVSKVVDENGEPLVVYHGATDIIETFDKSFLGQNTGSRSAKLAFFVSDSLEMARHYKFNPYDINSLLTKVQKQDFNLTAADAGISSDMFEPKKSDKIAKQQNHEYQDANYQIISKLVGKTYFTKTTITINPNESWIYSKNLKDYEAEGYEITEEDKIKYNSGQEITVTGKISHKIDFLTSVDNIIKNKELNEELYNEIKSDIKSYKDKLQEIDNKYSSAIKNALEEELKDEGIDDESLQAGLNPYVLPLFLNIRNIKVSDDKGLGFRLETYVDRIQDAIDSNKNGGVIKNTVDPYLCNVYYFFEPNQVKSATGNNGDFSIEDDSVYASAFEEGLSINDVAKTDSDGYRMVMNFDAFKSRLPMELQPRYDQLRESGWIETKC